MVMQKKVIFTDLDGTLLNNNYKFDDANRALDFLKEMEIPLIIVSSKTRAEIEVYRKKLGNNDPFISENGAAIFIPVDYFSGINIKKVKDKYEIIEIGEKHKKILRILKMIKEKVPIRAFSDMNARELVKDSGLSLKEAKLAKKREYDEAFKLENKKDEEMLIRLIGKYKLNYTKGGRYYHIMGNNDKGKAVKILTEFYKNKYGKVGTISLGDSQNDLPMLHATKKSFLIREGPKEWNHRIIHFLKLDNKIFRKGEMLFWNSVRILRRFQLKNGAILASSPKGRYPFVYPRDHSVCILGLIEARELKRARKALEFVLKSQNHNGSFPQRLDKKGRDVSYKPIQLDNTGLVLYVFAKYIKISKDKKFLNKFRGKIKRAVYYLDSQLEDRNLFFTPNSIHEFPPIEEGLEIWANAVCYSALRELEWIGIKSRIKLDNIKKAINKYFWNKKYFIKNIRLKESSSVVSDIDASSYALADYGVFDDENNKIESTVREIEKKLWHKRLGGICRYPEYVGRNNGGWGPWPHFTLMIARHFIRLGNKAKADKYLKWIFRVSYNNMLPEHIATKPSFEKWVNEYRKAGLMRKDREIMVRNIRKSEPYKNGVAYSVLPLAWPHAEFIRTWNLYKERFFKG